MAIQVAPPDTRVTTNRLVVDHATQRATLRLHAASLIGIVGPTGAPAALVRLRNGSVLKLAVGDDSPAGRVTAISDAAVYLTRLGQERVLRLPGH